MNITKAIIATVLYEVFIEAVAVWIFAAEFLGIECWEPHYEFIQALFQLSGVLIFLRFATKEKFKGVTQTTGLKWFFLSFVLGCSFIIIQTPLNWFYNLLFGTDYFIDYNFDGLSRFANINILSTILLIPIGEELFFRHYVQRGLHEKYSPFLAVAIASILFAAIHGPWVSFFYEDWAANWHLFYLTIFGGLISGVLFWKTRVITISILFHIMWNLVATFT